MRIPYINTNDGVTIVVANRSYTIAADDPNYERIIGLLETGAEEWEYLDVLESMKRKLVTTLALANDMEYSGGVVLYQGEVLSGYATDKLIQLIEAKKPYQPLANFVAKVMQNPSKRAVDHLYRFLEAGNVPLTEDGDFIVYKAVRDNYRDIHSGKFSNAVGSVVTMPRNAVDEDPDRTCSAGLHVCSFGYLPNFAHADGHVMMCKVSPADVVAIPADYNNTKMRVSRYEVVGEVEDYYGNRDEDVLGDIGRNQVVMEAEYTLVDEDGDDRGSYYTYEEAKRQAAALYEREELEVEVVDGDGFVVWTVNASGAY